MLSAECWRRTYAIHSSRGSWGDGLYAILLGALCMPCVSRREDLPPLADDCARGASTCVETCATVVGFADHKAQRDGNDAECGRGWRAGLKKLGGGSRGRRVLRRVLQEFFKSHLTMLRKQIKISPLCC